MRTSHGCDERLAVPPDEVSVEQAAALPLAGLTALRTLRLLPGGLLGRCVLITGASGGVGRFQSELAALGGACLTPPRNHSECGPSQAVVICYDQGASRYVTDTTDAKYVWTWPGYPQYCIPPGMSPTAC
jgi:hypothetical protein